MRAKGGDVSGMFTVHKAAEILTGNPGTTGTNS
jgi:hypothetical protein